MIISASRRTDIPACYSEWFFNRLNAGFAVTRNPFNPKQRKIVDLTPEAVDGFVFWTKDPKPMIARIKELSEYNYYFTFTLTPYGSDLEPNLRDKGSLLQTFKDLSLIIGDEKIIWRYDPIIITKKYNIQFHIDMFSEMAKELNGYTRKCVISFVDTYRSISKTLKSIGSLEITENDMRDLAEPMAKAALFNNLTLATCCEPLNLTMYKITQNKCIDAALLSKIAGREILARKDPNQRKACGCAASVDIGAYDTCTKGCLYCYALHSRKTLAKNIGAYNPDASCLLGDIYE